MKGKVSIIVIALLLNTLPIPLSAQVKADDDSISVINGNSFIQNETDLDNLLSFEKDYQKNGNNRKALAPLLKALRLKKAFKNKIVRARLFYDLAKVSIRLKLYPLAMKCYYKAIQLDGPVTLQSVQSPVAAISPNSTLIQTEFLMEPSGQDTTEDNFLLENSDTSLRMDNQPQYLSASEPVGASEIWESFDDGKPAVAFAFIIQVKQPHPGRRRPFTGINNVGHTFITLIKYNIDNSSTYRSFGYYPMKTSWLSATPLHPGSPAVFKDDAFHDWDEVIGKFVSYKQFQKIIRLIKHYDGRKYHLSQNNCTDFGLYMAAIAGLKFMNTDGIWPLGKGNNPANIGQSILDGKFMNADLEYQGPLFVCSSNFLSQR